MADRHSSGLAWASRLAICALALAGCSPAPAVVSTQPATATALSPAVTPTAAPTAQNTPAGQDNPAVPATSVKIVPQGIVFDADGNLYISDSGPYSDFGLKVVKVDQFGLLTTYAGSDSFGFSGDGGAALSALFTGVAGLALDRDGNLYLADSLNHRIRRIDRSGVVSTVAGSGPVTADAYCVPGSFPGGFAGDGGPATSALLNCPNDVAFDADGNLYIADSGNNRVRRVDQAGLITTVAGTGEPGFSGDGGPATLAALNNPGWLVLDAQDNLFISDVGNGRVRKIDRQGIISTFAGNGGLERSGDGGQATAAALSAPAGLTFDADGNLFVATDPVYVSNNHEGRVRKIDRNGVITTVAGTGEREPLGDGGPATSAAIHIPQGITFDSQGNLYIAEGDRVRRVDKQGIITTFAGGAP